MFQILNSALFVVSFHHLFHIITRTAASQSLYSHLRYSSFKCVEDIILISWLVLTFLYVKSYSWKFMQLSNSGKTDADVTLLFTWAVCRNFFVSSRSIPYCFKWMFFMNFLCNLFQHVYYLIFRIQWVVYQSSLVDMLIKRFCKNISYFNFN